jgi:hypothetical protein
MGHLYPSLCLASPMAIPGGFFFFFTAYKIWNGPPGNAGLIPSLLQSRLNGSSSKPCLAFRSCPNSCMSRGCGTRSPALTFIPVTVFWCSCEPATPSIHSHYASRKLVLDRMLHVGYTRLQYNSENSMPYDPQRQYRCTYADRGHHR